MAAEPADPVWEAFVVAMLAAGPARERPSRYGGKPALYTDKREIAHLEAPGVIDLRITQAGWSRLRTEFGQDQAVRHDRRPGATGSSCTSPPPRMSPAWAGC